MKISKKTFFWFLSITIILVFCIGILGTFFLFTEKKYYFVDGRIIIETPDWNQKGWCTYSIYINEKSTKAFDITFLRNQIPALIEVSQIKENKISQKIYEDKSIYRYHNEISRLPINACQKGTFIVALKNTTETIGLEKILFIKKTPLPGELEGVALFGFILYTCIFFILFLLFFFWCWQIIFQKRQPK